MQREKMEATLGDSNTDKKQGQKAVEILKQESSVEDFGVVRVVRGETPPQSSPEARPLDPSGSVSPPQSSPVESVSSREMGKLLRTRSMHVELQSDPLAVDWESESPLAKHALSTSDLPSMARAPSPPLPPPMSPVPPEPAP